MLLALCAENVWSHMRESVNILFLFFQYFFSSFVLCMTLGWFLCIGKDECKCSLLALFMSVMNSRLICTKKKKMENKKSVKKREYSNAKKKIYECYISLQRIDFRTHVDIVNGFFLPSITIFYACSLFFFSCYLCYLFIHLDSCINYLHAFSFLMMNLYTISNIFFLF